MNELSRWMRSRATPIRCSVGRWRAGTAVAFALTFVAACGGSDEPVEPPVASASATIGAAGGTVIGPDDVRVVVPAGALQADTVITIRRSAAGAPALPARAASAPAMYEFTPHGLRFESPVTISMPSTRDDDVDPVLMAQPGEDWQLVAATTAAGRVSWAATHFSWSFQYPCGASYPPGTPVPPNSPDCEFPSSGVLVAAAPATAMTPVVPYHYRVVAEADVTVSFRYSAPLSCINPAIKTTDVRYPQNVDLANVPATPVVLTRTPVQGIPGAFRLTGSSDVVFHFGPTDNGVRSTGFFFACEGGIRVGGGVLFTVAVPAPPVPVAPPVIAQEPADASVVAPANVAFDVLASAVDNLTIRWERQDAGAPSFVVASGAAPLPGGSRLAFAAQLADSAARIRARVCNSRGGIDSCVYTRVAMLTVTAPPPPPSAFVTSSRLSGAFLGACGISTGGNALCWGANSSGELGRGSSEPASATPAAATGLAGVTSIGASSFIACAVHGGGRLSCWGGYPGEAQFEQSAVPVEIAGVTDARLVRVANGSVCYVDADRRVRCRDASGPLQIDGQVVEGALDVAFAAGGRCVLLASGDTRCAQYDGSAALVTSRVVPMVRSLGSGPGYAGLGVPLCVVLQSGDVRCWGSNGNGQLGLGHADTAVSDATVPGIGPALAVAVGTRHACALAVDGTVSCWGSGYLGNGAGVETAQAPRAVSGLAGIVEITAGFDTTCALRNDGQVLCWGDNAQGSIGTGTVGGVQLVPRPTVAGAQFAH